MLQTTTTLNSLLNALESEAADVAAVFTTKSGEIGEGYHVTELKLADIQSIDCAGRIDNWQETQLQLLDGNSGNHISVKKFSGIVRASISKIPELADAPLSVEFSPNNEGLQRYEIERVSAESGRVLIELSQGKATCKPAAVTISKPEVKTGCCAKSENCS